MIQLCNDWGHLLAGEFSKDYYLQLRKSLLQEYAANIVYPDKYDIYNALSYTSYADTRVVILGQDPYHGANQAHGLCFSVKKGITPPPSLQNIFKEMHDDLGIPIPNHGELTAWAKQGVLLLNTILTVRAGQPTSHKGMGWETFTDAVIQCLNDKPKPVVFLLWGAHARKKAELITNPKHVKLCCPHPSPLSAYNGFFGCRHFSAANEILTKSKQIPIDWRL